MTANLSVVKTFISFNKKSYIYFAKETEIMNLKYLAETNIKQTFTSSTHTYNKRTSGQLRTGTRIETRAVSLCQPPGSISYTLNPQDLANHV